MRVAGANAGRNIILQRCRALQDRIAELKARLRGYENVEDWHFDDAPIVIDESASQG
ncbi:MAG: hypothetical protein ACREM6_02080 [Vulcanimicrobiaceae bacterium]